MGRSPEKLLLTSATGAQHSKWVKVFLNIRVFTATSVAARALRASPTVAFRENFFINISISQSTAWGSKYLALRHREDPGRAGS